MNRLQQKGMKSVLNFTYSNWSRLEMWPIIGKINTINNLREAQVLRKELTRYFTIFTKFANFEIKISIRHSALYQSSRDFPFPPFQSQGETRHLCSKTTMELLQKLSKRCKLQWFAKKWLRWLFCEMKRTNSRRRKNFI